MNDPAASGRGILEGFSFKSRGKPRGIKPTCGIKNRQDFGEVAEWFKAAVLKTVERKFRGFESYPLRQAKSGAKARQTLALLTNHSFYAFPIKGRCGGLFPLD